MALVCFILVYFSSSVVYSFDASQTIENAHTVKDLFPLISELIPLDELQNILLSKINGAKPRIEKEGGVTPTKVQSRLNQLRRQRALNKTKLDEFLLENGLSNMFDNGTFYDKNITLDIITQENNRLNYKVSKIADIVCKDNCSATNRLRLISSIAKARKMDEFESYEKNKHMKKQKCVELVNIINNTIDYFELKFENETEAINELVMKWRNEKTSLIEQSMIDLTRNTGSDTGLKKLKKQYDGLYNDIKQFMVRMSTMNDIGSVIDSPEKSLYNGDELQMAPNIELLSTTAYQKDKYKRRFDLKVKWRYYYSKFDQINKDQDKKICNDITFFINGIIADSISKKKVVSESCADTQQFVDCSGVIKGIKARMGQYMIEIRRGVNVPFKMKLSDYEVKSFWKSVKHFSGDFALSFGERWFGIDDKYKMTCDLF